MNLSTFRLVIIGLNLYVEDDNKYTSVIRTCNKLLMKSYEIIREIFFSFEEKKQKNTQFQYEI